MNIPGKAEQKNMRKEKEKYSFGGYKYAPESVKFTLNGKVLNLPEELRSTLAYKAVCGKTKEVVDELKRFVRQRRRESNIAGVAYGFYGTGSTEYYFTRDLIATETDSLAERARVYKAWKHFLKDRDCVVELPYIVEEGELAPNGIQQLKSGQVTVRVDLMRPVTVRFRKERMVA